MRLYKFINCQAIQSVIDTTYLVANGFNYGRMGWRLFRFKAFVEFEFSLTHYLPYPYPAKDNEDPKQHYLSFHQPQL